MGRNLIFIREGSHHCSLLGKMNTRATEVMLKIIDYCRKSRIFYINEHRMLVKHVVATARKIKLICRDSFL